MRLSTYRLADYRLAAYVVVAALVGGAIALAIDSATAPTVKVEANGAPPASGGVRQIAISKTTAADLGDPDGKLSPVYPAAPGKDLPVKDTPVVQAAKEPVKPQAETNGSANATGQSASGQTASPAPVAAAPIAPMASQPTNACNVQACAAAYRSFRESDCSYQPMVGARRVCEGAPGLGGPSSTGQVAAQPPQQQPQARRQYDPNSTAPIGRSRYDDELRDAQRAARNLPPPSGARDDDDDDNVVVIEAPQQRYDIRRNWIMEPQD